MFKGIVKDSALLYAGTKLVKKATKHSNEHEALFTDEFKKKSFDAIMASIDKTQAKLEAYTAKKEMEIQGRKIKVTK